MELKDLSKPLDVTQIDFRVQSINKGGYATILAYKDARVDMQRLDDVCGPLNWKREHCRDNQNCIVSIYNDKTSEWVGKEDTGTQSMAEAAKGLASDSFKRACFNWGIGRELYDYPVISIKLNKNEFEINNNKAKQTWGLKLKEWVWRSEFQGKKMVFLEVKDQTGQIRYSWGEGIPVETKELPRALYGAYESIFQFYNEGDFQSVGDAFKSFELKEEASAVWKMFGSKQRSTMTKFTNSDEYKQRKGIKKVRILSESEHKQFCKDFNY